MTARMVLQDFTLLGWTAPHVSKKHGEVICAAGYSRSLNQFVRIYPLPYPFPVRLNRWDQIHVPLIRNDEDNRRESWKIDYGDRTSRELCALVRHTGTVTKDWEKDWLFKRISLSIAQLNAEKQSLGLLKPIEIRPAFRLAKIEIISDSLFADNSSTCEQNPLTPTIEVVNPDRTTNTMQLLEWGCSEYLRKNPGKQEGLWNALFIDNPAYEHILLVGNHNQYRNAWLAIAMLSYKVAHGQQIEMQFIGVAAP